MKKLLVLFALLLLFTLPASAAQSFYVYDEADLLTDMEEEELSAMAEKLSLHYECGIHIAAVDTYYTYSDAHGISAYAEDFYNHHLLGYGTEQNGILLLLSMEEREYDICVYGANAQSVFTEPGKEVLSEAFLDDFANDDWFWGFYDYIDACDTLLFEAENGGPVYTPGAIEESSAPNLLIIFVPPLIIALIVCLIFLSQMKTARRRRNAQEYVADRGINVYIRQDFFTHRTTHRQVIQKSSGGSGGSRGGFSHRSGKF